VAPPALAHRVQERQAYYPSALVQRDYLMHEASNQSLGLAGEEFVVDYERWRPIQRGCEHLAARIEHTSKVRGDGAGYDVLSFEEDGRERFIEVKTTAYAKETPFSSVTANFGSRTRMSWRFACIGSLSSDGRRECSR